MKPVPPIARLAALRLPALATCVALLSGCGLVSQQLHVSDDSRGVASARVAKRLGSGPGGPGVELEVTRAQARGTQVVPTGSLVTAGGVTLNGPISLQHRATVDGGHLVYNHLLFPGRPVELEWFAGGAWQGLRWDSTSSRAGDAALRTRNRWYGPTGGALARLQLVPGFTLEGRYAGAIALKGTIVDSGSRTLTEAALAWRPGGGVVLRGGYAELRTVMRPDFDNSELSVRARGPFLNLGLEF
jgi:hypothetical protein